MNIPNLLTLARLMAVPLVVYLILQGAFAAAFWLFVFAGITDAADGFIAKRFNMQSRLGGYLDPVADKVLLVGVYIALGHINQLATWLVILVVFRDLLIVGGVILIFLMTGTASMRPLYISKVNTAAQIALVAILLAGLGLSINVGWLILPCVYIVAATTLASGASYLVNWARQADMEEQQ